MERDPNTLVEFRVRSEPGSSDRHVEVRGTVDRQRETITVDVPDGFRTTVDVVVARAIYMLLGAAVYGALDPNGPYLRVERLTEHGWPTDTTDTTDPAAARKPQRPHQ